MTNFQTICGRCREPLFNHQHTTIINPNGIIEVRLVCGKCGRKWYGAFGVPEDFVVVKEEKINGSIRESTEHE